MEALKVMKRKGLFEEMLIYLEGSETGSVFQGQLPHDLNVLAVTASGPKETSLAAYCFPNDRVQGQNFGICLSDSFSLNWMRDTESHCPLKETLGMQLKNVRNATTMTTVSPYGDLSLLHAKVGEFIGAVEPAYSHSSNNPLLDILIEQIRIRSRSATREMRSCSTYSQSSQCSGPRTLKRTPII